LTWETTDRGGTARERGHTVVCTGVGNFEKVGPQLSLREAIVLEKKKFRLEKEKKRLTGWGARGGTVVCRISNSLPVIGGGKGVSLEGVQGGRPPKRQLNIGLSG